MKNNIKSLALLFACILLTFQTVSGQGSAWTSYNISNSSLPDNSIRCIAFENDSTAWIGTDWGLARLVNGQWTVFNTANSGIGDNGIRSLVIDKNGVKWIGTFNNGLSIFNDTTWILKNTQNSPLPSDFVRSLGIDTNHVVWAGTIGGLCRIDSLTTYTIYDQFNSILNSNNMASMYVDTISNNKWVGTINGGLISIDKDTNFTEFITQNSGISDNTILGIDMDNLGNLWMASPANGLIVKLNGFGWFTYNQLSSNIPTPGLTCVKLDQTYQPWIGTFDKGILYKNGSNFIAYDTSNSPLTDVMIQCVNIDDSGRVWIGTQTGGLFILDPSLLTGLDEVYDDISLSLYPNPAGSFLYYNSLLPVQRVEVFDISGRLLLQELQVKNAVDLSTLKSGLYQARFLFDDGRVLVKKFMKQ